jgi:glycerophosphoryl diester phosphodiesterase
MKIVGHRGARGIAPENTIAALKTGLKHHVDELEFDLRVTKDKVVILSHDESIVGSDGNLHLVKKTSYKKLLEQKPDLATFEEVLNTIGKKITLYVEVKPEIDLEPVIPIIKDYYDRGWHNMEIASFSQDILMQLHRIFPMLPMIVLESRSAINAHRRAKQLDTPYIAMNQRWLWWGVIWMHTHLGGYKLYTYTLNNPIKAQHWAKYGLYAVVTDNPDLFDKM